MIVFACLVPHPPIIIPEIGKDNTERLKKTQEAYKKLALDLKESRASTLLVISPHGQTTEDVMLINQNVEYRADLSAFGYLGAREKWRGNPGLAQRISSACEGKNNLRLYTRDELDHGSAVPLLMLAKNISGLKIIPLSYSGRGNREHFDFGRLIRPVLADCKEKIGLIASGDLSHCLSKEAPAGYSPRGAKFDNKLKDLLVQKKTGEIIDLPASLIADAAECGLRSIVTLLGILEGSDYRPKVLSYEAPFGVGYLCLDFRLDLRQ